MTTHRPAERDGGISLAQRDVQQVVDTLVARAILTPDQALAATEALSGPRMTGPATSADAAGRRRAAEIAGYVGGALVVSAAGLFLTTSWSSLARGQRLALLAGLALALAVAGAALIRGVDVARLRREADPARRRLVSTLWVGAAVCAGGAAYAAVAPFGSGETTTARLTGGLVALVVAVAGYALVPSLFGQVTNWLAVWWVTATVAELLDVDYGNAFGVALVVLGAGWVALGALRVFRERETALALGVIMALFGAQTPLLDGTHAVAYVLTGVVAVACFAAQLRLRAWPLLAGGVAATTLVVPEAVRAATDDALPVTGVLLVAGLTLLAACALGLRLRREPVGDASPDGRTGAPSS
jgi:hypothetical protein